MVTLKLNPDSDNCADISALCPESSEEAIINSSDTPLFTSCCLGWDYISFALGYSQTVQMHPDNWQSWLTTHAETKF